MSGALRDGATEELLGGDGGLEMRGFGLDECGFGLDECGCGLERTWAGDGAGSATGRDDSTAELLALLRTPVGAGAGATDPPHPDAAVARAHTAATAERSGEAIR